MMKIAFSTLCCTEKSVDEIIDLTLKTKINAVELRVDDVLLSELLDSEEKQNAFRKSGVPVCDVASSIFVRGEGELSAWKSYIQLAHKLGSPAVRVFASCMSDGKLTLDGIAEDLRVLCDIAAELGIEIWLENHSELSRGATCRQIIDMVDRPNLKILWDVLHSIEYGEGLEETLTYIADSVAHVHLKDGYYVEGQTEYKLCALGEGSFPFCELAVLLEKYRYDGHLSLEWESKWHPSLAEVYADNFELLEKYKEILKKTGFAV
jgi:sugar phosphate isomerase/epimerase